MSRRTCLVAGVSVLLAAWSLRDSSFLPGPFAAHMTMHMGVVAVAAPLLAAGFAGGRLDAALRWPGLMSPIVASFVELVVVWGWHAPALHHAARHSLLGLMAEQATFLATGWWLWQSALGGRVSDAARAGRGVFALLLTSMHMTLLGALLALAPRPLYLHHPLGERQSTLADQELGGAIMIAAGGASYLAGGLWLSSRLVRQRGFGRAGAR